MSGVTGLVITLRPGVIRMDRDLPEQNLHRGDTILTYTYRGEGFSAVWLQGRYYPEFDISFTKWPDGSGCGGAHCAATYLDFGEKVWWAEVKLKSGRQGWVNMNDAKFDGVDMLALLHEDPRRFRNLWRDASLLRLYSFRSAAMGSMRAARRPGK